MVLTAHHSFTHTHREKKNKESRCLKNDEQRNIERKHKGLIGKDGFCVQESELSHRFPASNEASFVSINMNITVHLLLKGFKST